MNSLTRIEATHWARRLLATLPENDRTVSIMVPTGSPGGSAVLSARLRGHWHSRLAPDGSGFERYFTIGGVEITAQAGQSRVYRRRLRSGWSIWWFLREAADALQCAHYNATSGQKAA